MNKRVTYRIRSGNLNVNEGISKLVLIPFSDITLKNEYLQITEEGTEVGQRRFNQDNLTTLDYDLTSEYGKIKVQIDSVMPTGNNCVIDVYLSRENLINIDSTTYYARKYGLNAEVSGIGYTIPNNTDVTDIRGNSTLILGKSSTYEKDGVVLKKKITLSQLDSRARTATLSKDKILGKFTSPSYLALVLVYRFFNISENAEPDGEVVTTVNYSYRELKV